MIMKPLVWKAMLDSSDFIKKIDEAQKYARDNKKKLDQKYVLELELNKTVADMKVKELKELLKNKDLDMARKVLLEIDLTRAKKQAVEANALLNNYLNTGDEKLSRFRSAFSSISKWFSEIWVAIANGVVGIAAQKIKELTDAIANYFSDSIKLAKEYETAFAWVRKTVEATAKEYQWLKNQLKELSERIPMSFTELAKIMELGGQLWVQKNNLVKFTEVVAKLGTATNMTSEAAADLLAKYANILKMPLDKIDQLWSVIVKLGNNFATTESDVTNFSSRIAGAGKIADMSAAEIMAISTAFSSVGIEAEAGGTAVQKVILDMNAAAVNWGGQLKKYADALGISAQEFKKMRDEDSTGTFVKFIEKLWEAGKSAQGILNWLGLNDQRLTRSFLSLAQNSDLLTNAINLANEARTENIALSAEAEQRFATTESKIILEQNERANSMSALWEKLVGMNLLWEETKTWFIKMIWWILWATTEHNEKTEELIGNITELTDEMRKLRSEYDAGAISIDEYARKMVILEERKKEAEAAKEEEIKRLEKLRKEIKLYELHLEEALKANVTATQKIKELTDAGKENTAEMQRWTDSVRWSKELVEFLNSRLEDLHAEYEHGPWVTKEYIEHTKKLDKAQSKLNEQMEAFNNQEIKKGSTVAQFEAMRIKAIETTKELIALYNAEALLGWMKISKNSNHDLSPRVSKTAGVNLRDSVSLVGKIQDLQWLTYEKWRSDFDSSTNTRWWGWGGGSKKDPITRKKEELKKLRDLEIDNIQKSEKTEKEKYKTILEINENYKNKLADLEGKTTDAIIKKAEESAKKEEKIVKNKYQDINKAIEKSKDHLKNYWKAVEDIEKKRKESLKWAKEEISSLNHEMKQLDQDYFSDMAERYVKVKDALGKDNLDIEERNKLQQELNFLMEKTTEEQRNQAEESARLSESQKRELEYQKQKVSLQERINIAQAFSSQKDFSERKIEIWENEDGSLKASYTDEKWEVQKVVDYKNIQYLADLANKQTVMKKEMEELKAKIEEEFKFYEDLNKKKEELEKKQTEILKEEMDKRKEELSEYTEYYEKEAKKQIDIAKRVAREMQAATAYAVSRSSTGKWDKTTINNNWGNTNNTIYNINNPSDASLAVLKEMTNRMNPL